MYVPEILNKDKCWAMRTDKQLLHLQAGFLQHLACHTFLAGFIHINKPTGQVQCSLCRFFSLRHTNNSFLSFKIKATVAALELK